MSEAYETTVRLSGIQSTPISFLARPDLNRTVFHHWSRGTPDQPPLICTDTQVWSGSHESCFMVIMSCVFGTSPLRVSAGYIWPQLTTVSYPHRTAASSLRLTPARIRKERTDPESHLQRWELQQFAFWNVQCKCENLNHGTFSPVHSYTVEAPHKNISHLLHDAVFKCSLSGRGWTFVSVPLTRHPGHEWKLSPGLKGKKRNREELINSETQMPDFHPSMQTEYCASGLWTDFLAIKQHL